MTMKHSGGSWTEERFEILKRLWAEGHSAAQIAHTLGGVSRNAVLSKVHREGIAERRNGYHRRPSKSVFTPRIKSQPRRPPAPQDSPDEENRRDRRQRLPSGALEAAPPVDQSVDFDIPVERRRTLLELTYTMCRWPVGMPGTREFFFCADTKLESQPYCEAHCKRAFQNAPIQ